MNKGESKKLAPVGEVNRQPKKDRKKMMEKEVYGKFGFWKVKDLKGEGKEEFGESLDANQIYAGEADEPEKVFICSQCGGFIVDEFHWGENYSPCKHFLFTFDSTNNEFRFVSDWFAAYLRHKYKTHSDYEGDDESDSSEEDLLEFCNEKCPDDDRLFFLEEKVSGLRVLDSEGQAGHYRGCQEGLVYGIGSDDFIKKISKLQKS